MGNVGFSWQPSTDAESSIKYYELYIDNVKKVEVSGTSYTYPLLDKGIHSWYVTAVNGSGLSKASTSTFNFTAASTTAIPTVKMGNRDLNVYPNPFHDKINISLPDSKGLNRIRIIDITGRTIVEKTVKGDLIQFDLSICRSGLYNLIVDGNNGTKTCKLIKK